MTFNAPSSSADLRSGANPSDDFAAPGRKPALPTLTGTGKVLGTLPYMAPEQLEHPQDVEVLKSAISQTVSDRSQVDQELHGLLQLLG